MPQTPTDPLSETPVVRVMSSNIRFATRLDGSNAWVHRRDFYLETIRAFDPDLLGTQETLGSQLSDLLAGLPGYAFLAAGRDDGLEKGEMMALFYRETRFERLDGGHFWLSLTPETPGSKSWYGSFPRMVTWVKLRDRLDDRPVAFFNTHFDHLSPRARRESALLLRRKASSASCRVVISGDFNCGEDGEPYRALFGDSKIVDTFRAVYPVRGADEGTYNGFRAGNTKGNRIDWIGVSPDWEVLSVGIDRTSRGGRTPSDHFPVTAVLRPIEGHF